MQTETPTTKPTKKRKSVPLTKEERKALKDFAKKFKTGVECSEALGIDRASMERILLVGSGSAANIEQVRSVINAEPAAE